MIDYLRGTVTSIEAEYIVVDVSGVGYRLFCPDPSAFQAHKDQEYTVFVHHHVRDDAILLFGFASREQQALFRRLIDVSGIGPRVAIGILSGGRPEAIIAAVQQEDIAYLTTLPGIGKKTAQRMILELKDKLGNIPLSSDVAAAILQSPSATVTGEHHQAWAEARDALSALGYSATELDQAWQRIKDQVREKDSVDTLIKMALQALFKG